MIYQEPVVIEQPYYVMADASREVIVTAGSLNLRSGPGYEFSVMDTLYQGDRLIVRGYDISSGWLYVELSSGDFGWVMAQYTAPEAPYQCG